MALANLYETPSKGHLMPRKYDRSYFHIFWDVRAEENNVLLSLEKGELFNAS